MQLCVWGGRRPLRADILPLAFQAAVACIWEAVIGLSELRQDWESGSEPFFSWGLGMRARWSAAPFLRLA